MELNLMDLKRYAIDRRIEIKFDGGAPDQHCLINANGHAKIPGENKDGRIEDWLAAAQSFEIIGPGKPSQLTREEMAKTLADAFSKRGSVASSHDDD
jgi:hypothetical protein